VVSPRARRRSRFDQSAPDFHSPALEGWEAFLESVDPLDVYEDVQKLRTGAKSFDSARLLDPVNKVGEAFRARVGVRLKEVLAARKNIEDAMPALAREYDDRRLSVEVPGRQAISLAPAFLAEILTMLRAPSFSAKKIGRLEGYDQAQRDAFSAIYPVRDKVANVYAAPLREFTRKRNAFDALTDRLAAAADSLFAIERELYEKTIPVNEASACRDFVL
jgi:hypothetical protein